MGAPDGLGPEATRYDTLLASRPPHLAPETRDGIWTSAQSILRHGPDAEGQSIGLALGYVQSGKTTAFSALTALAADAGYKVIIAFLGATRLLLDQNMSRLETALGLDTRTDYVWQTITNPKGAKGGKEIAEYLGRGRVLIIPVLKHAGRIADVASALVHVDMAGVRALVVDDEADQASLNTRVSAGEESKTYAAVAAVRAALPTHLYVQYTATPYAPLLLEPHDDLQPDFVELLHPGPGYTGGREFFVDNADKVVRVIPDLDEQPPRGLPTVLPGSLVTAAASFVAGAALLLENAAATPPISMLVHSTHKNDVQQRYHFLLDRKIKQWRKAVAAHQIPQELLVERQRLVTAGAAGVPEEQFHRGLVRALGEATLWLVNSASEVAKVEWRSAPVHILVGGNKLDRGFTVEGLTVTYMNRPTSLQIDTLEQRARAFGYRQDLLPYCQFFATARTVETLRGTVYTEYDLRAELRDWIEAGGDVNGWAQHVGLMLPHGTKPTRDAVLTHVDRFNVGGAWHQLRRPNLDQDVLSWNATLVDTLGVRQAPAHRFGRIMHPVLESLSVDEVRERLLEPWMLGSYSPGWDHERILGHLSRHPARTRLVRVLYLEHPSGQARERAWDTELGFSNLLQGPDPGPSRADSYPGDRYLYDHDSNPLDVEIQIHRVRPKGLDIASVHTLALYLGDRVAVRRAGSLTA
jgi:hypothetical protein